MTAVAATTSSKALLRTALVRAREFFLLREAEEHALPLHRRDAAIAQLRLAEQRRRAALALFAHGERAEALRLAREAYGLVRPLLDDATGVTNPIVTAADAAVAQPQPQLDEELTDVHETWFDEVTRACRHVHRQVSVLALDALERTRWRRQRAGLAAVSLFAVVASIAWAVLRRSVSAEASAYFSGRYLPENTLDGSLLTHWLLPDRTTGWIDFKLAPPRRVTSVTVINAVDPPGYGVLDYRLEAYVGETLIKKQDGTLGSEAAKTPVLVPFVVDDDVERVRLVVVSHRGTGAGLAEVTIR